MTLAEYATQDERHKVFYQMLAKIQSYASRMDVRVYTLAFKANAPKLQKLMDALDMFVPADAGMFTVACRQHAVDWLTYLDPEKAAQEARRLGLVHRDAA